MKKILLSAVSLAVLSGSALAADLPSRKAPVAPPPPAPLWTGFYAGLNLGGGWSAGNGNADIYNLGGANGGITNNIGGGVIGGVQVGYNYQLNTLAGGALSAVVIGAEADFQGTTMSSSSNRIGLLPAAGTWPNYTGYAPYWRNGGASLPWYGTVRGRLGYSVMPTLLVYGTGGFAYGDSQRTTAFGGSNNATQTGWTAGGGLEWMFMPNWSTKVEYLYTDISGGNSNTYGWNVGTSLNNVNNHTRWNTVRAGVNYHFNWAAAPVVAAF